MPTRRTTRFAVLTAILAAACSSQEPPAGKEAAAVATNAEPAAPAPVTRPLLLLGIDGADWRVLDPLLAAGRLPNFAKLIEHGVRAPLQTFEPCLSPLIWTTLATGFAPHKHGITGFTAKDPASGEELLVTSNLRRVPALWNILSDAGQRVGVTGWWATYPAEEVTGFVISDQAFDLRRANYAEALDLPGLAGSGAADPRATWPPDLAERLRAELSMTAAPDPALLARFMDLPPERLAALAARETVDKEDVFSIFRFALAIDRSLVAAWRTATGDAPPAFNAIYLNGLDAAEHHFWRFREPDRFAGVAPGDVRRYGKVIDEYYVYVDEVLGGLLERYPLDRSLVLVVSDHGHEANPKYDPASPDHFNRVCSGTHEHAPDGVFILAGRDARVGAALSEQPNIFDVAPTVLALMGIPVGGDMPGRVLTEAVDPAFLEAHPVRRVPSHNAGWEHGAAPIRSPLSDSLREKLKGLGYIE
jgi:predicted AlkP superfamily pyrophosphatase or phosphodiesterase